MYCTGCGNKLEDDELTCAHCGKNNEVIVITKEASEHEMGGDGLPRESPPVLVEHRRARLRWPIAALIVICIIVAAAALVLFGVVRIGGTDWEKGGTYQASDQDGDDGDFTNYTLSRSEVLQEADARTSKDTLSESQVLQEFSDRGFKSIQLSAVYDSSGQYYENTHAVGDSTERHPLYEGFYESAAGEFWTLYLVADQVMALPVSFNLESEDVELVVTERDYITGYSSETGKFYRTVPDAGEAGLIKVDRIDASELDRLTSEEIHALRQ